MPTKHDQDTKIKAARLVRVQHRTAVLAIIPAASVVVAWLVGIAALAGLAVIERRWA